MSATESEVLSVAEALGDALAEEKSDLDRTEFFGLVMRCNQAIEQEIGVDYGSICSDNSC
ncbi:MAG: halo-CC-star protein HcsS [Halohasta sp.]